MKGDLLTLSYEQRMGRGGGEGADIHPNLLAYNICENHLQRSTLFDLMLDILGTFITVMWRSHLHMSKCNAIFTKLGEMWLPRCSYRVYMALNGRLPHNSHIHPAIATKILWRNECNKNRLTWLLLQDSYEMALKLKVRLQHEGHSPLIHWWLVPSILRLGSMGNMCFSKIESSSMG